MSESSPSPADPAAQPGTAEQDSAPKVEEDGAPALNLRFKRKKSKNRGRLRSKRPVAAEEDAEGGEDESIDRYVLFPGETAFSFIFFFFCLLFCELTLDCTFLLHSLSHIQRENRRSAAAAEVEGQKQRRRFESFYQRHPSSCSRRPRGGWG